LAHLKDFYELTKPFQEFELLPGAAQWKLLFNQEPFFKTNMPAIDKIIPVSIALD